MAHTLSTTSSHSQVTKPKPNWLEWRRVSRQNTDSNLGDGLFVYRSLTLHLLPARRNAIVVNQTYTAIKTDCIYFSVLLEVFSHIVDCGVRRESANEDLLCPCNHLKKHIRNIEWASERKNDSSSTHTHVYTQRCYLLEDLRISHVGVSLSSSSSFSSWSMLLNGDACTHTHTHIHAQGISSGKPLSSFICRRSICCPAELMNLVVIRERFEEEKKEREKSDKETRLSERENPFQHDVAAPAVELINKWRGEKIDLATNALGHDHFVFV